MTDVSVTYTVGLLSLLTAAVFSTLELVKSRSSYACAKT